MMQSFLSLRLLFPFISVPFTESTNAFVAWLSLEAIVDTSSSTLAVISLCVGMAVIQSRLCHSLKGVRSAYPSPDHSDAPDLNVMICPLYLPHDSQSAAAPGATAYLQGRDSIKEPL